MFLPILRCASDPQADSANCDQLQNLTYAAFQSVFNQSLLRALCESDRHRILELTPTEEEGLATVRDGLRAGLQELRTLKHAGKDWSEEYRKQRSRISELYAEEARIIERSRARDPVAVSMARPQAAGIEEIHAVLPIGAVLAEYMLDEDNAYCAVSSRSGTEILDLGKSNELMRNVDLLRRTLADSNLPPDPILLRDLGRSLVDPVLKWSMESPVDSLQTVLVAPHGDLGTVPFEVLLTRDVQANTPATLWPFLVRDYDVGYVHSGSIFKAMKLSQALQAEPIQWELEFVALALPLQGEPVLGELGQEDNEAVRSLGSASQVLGARPLIDSALEALEAAKFFAATKEEVYRIERVSRLITQGTGATEWGGEPDQRCSFRCATAETC